MRLGKHLRIYCRALKMIFNWDRTFALCWTVEAVLSAGAPYVPIYFSAKLVDGLYQGEDFNTMLIYALLAVGIVFVLKVLETYISSLRDKCYNEIYRQEEWQYSKKAMNMAYESTESQEVALLRARIRMESQTGYNSWWTYYSVEEICRNLTKIVCSISMTISFFVLPSVPVGMKLGLVFLLAITIVVSIFTTKKSQKLTEDYYVDAVHINTFCNKYEEYISDYSAAKDIRLYHMEEGIAQLVGETEGKINQKGVVLAKQKLLLDFPNVVLNHVLKYATYLVLIVGAIAGAVSIGSIAQYVSCIMLLLTAVSELVRVTQIALNNNHYLKRYFSYFDIPNEMYKGTLTVEKRDDVEYYVEFRNVSFKYPGTDTYALRNINMKFKIGEKLAVVGMNGSGKTTFIKLMCRLYDPTEGEILLNGVNIQKYDYDEYMSIFSVTFQDFAMFGFSLGQNVAASKVFDSRKVIACLKKVGLEKFLTALPKGLDTCLYKGFDQEGVEISGGEAQKIALARALYKDAPFIILDEPTAALDPVSEYEVYSKFNEIAGDKTAIYISHRLASCRFCDKIAVFHEGRIIQQGSHEDLLAEANGKYCELWNAQAQYYVV